VVSGLVQGVGFRPFIYRIATESNVKGFVRNMGGSEVEIVIQGGKREISTFFSLFYLKLPAPARIESLRVEGLEECNFGEFRIMPSSLDRREPSQIPPDFTVCDDCLREVLDQRNRRYRYPFNSCAYCGPRFSMIMAIPYDRENTSMRDFPLCEHCSGEYSNPTDERRFDAQGISCPICGPRLFLEDLSGERVEGDPILQTAKLLSEGHIVAVKGVGGYHIAVNPFNDDLVKELRRRKNRPEKPFAVMSISTSVVSRYAYLSREEVEALESPERPIVLLRKREESQLSKYISPGLDREGFFLYYTPLHYLILREVEGNSLIMTSGNKHGYPMCIDEKCVREKLKGIADYVLYHNRQIVNRVDDSVMKFTGSRRHLLRRGRGFAPLWIRLRRIGLPGLAIGAELGNAGGVLLGDKAILTQYVGDTDRVDNLVQLERSLDFLLRTYGVAPKVVITDKNPAYQSRRLARKYAERFSAQLVEVQHHFAHALSVSAERGVEEGIAITIDGVGYGDDGNAWGGEILRFRGADYSREFHLRYIPYPGGDVNALKPRRMLANFLGTFMDWEEAGKVAGIPPEEVVVLSNLNRRPGLLTSSTGRFLDAVSAYLGVCHRRTYEGEPAIKLEAAAKGGKVLDLDLPVRGREIDTVEAFKWLVSHDPPLADAAATVLYRLGEALVKAALRLNPDVILVSGGAAVNEYILKGMEDNSQGIRVVTPSKVPAGDGGIALGQLNFSTLANLEGL
jgi:hydrogenase maturation protein HypF